MSWSSSSTLHDEQIWVWSHLEFAWFCLVRGVGLRRARMARWPSFAQVCFCMMVGVFWWRDAVSPIWLAFISFCMVYLDRVANEICPRSMLLCLGWAGSLDPWGLHGACGPLVLFFITLLDLFIFNLLFLVYWICSNLSISV